MMLDRNEVDGAGDTGLEALGRNPLDLANSRLAGGELAPVVLAARAKRRNDAHAGGDDERPARLVSLRHCASLQSTASTRARPSPRRCPMLVTTTCRSDASIVRSTPDSSAGGNSRPCRNAAAASAILAGNCGSRPCPRWVPVARTARRGCFATKARSSAVIGSTPLAPERIAALP